jgi:hypothetical protein
MEGNFVPLLLFVPKATLKTTTKIFGLESYEPRKPIAGMAKVRPAKDF